jgi:hypothetical protein
LPAGDDVEPLECLGVGTVDARNPLRKAGLDGLLLLRIVVRFRLDDRDQFNAVDLQLLGDTRMQISIRCPRPAWPGRGKLADYHPDLQRAGGTFLGFRRALLHFLFR